MHQHLNKSQLLTLYDKLGYQPMVRIITTISSTACEKTGPKFSQSSEKCSLLKTMTTCIWKHATQNRDAYHCCYNFLIQQLIQSLQGYNMAIMSGRHSRSLPDLLTTARVLQLIDEFPVCSFYTYWSRIRFLAKARGSCFCHEVHTSSITTCTGEKSDEFDH